MINADFSNDPKVGSYKGLLNNCGSWVVKQLGQAQIEIPPEVRALNHGVGVGGSPVLTAAVAYPVTYAMAGYGYAKRGVTGAGSVVASSGTRLVGTVANAASDIAASASFETFADDQNRSYVGFAVKIGP